MIDTQAALTPAEACELVQGSLHYLGSLAHEVRNRLNDPRRVTFVVDRNISYTNVCVAQCNFCNFSVPEGSAQGFVLSETEIYKKIEELEAAGGTQILLQGGLNPEIPFDFYINLLQGIKNRFPQITIHSFSPTEIDFFSKTTDSTVREILLVLKQAGLDSLPGGGGEILVDRVRRIISPKKISADRWCEVMCEAHRAGFKTTATMVIGSVETWEERIAHLFKVRSLQAETGGFRAFIPWTMMAQGTRLSSFGKTAGEDYLRTLAIGRIILDNIPHIQSGWLTEGQELAELTLFFGADDMGGILMEDQVITRAGFDPQTQIATIKRLIRDAGFIPAQRNTQYEITREFDE